MPEERLLQSVIIYNGSFEDERGPMHDRSVHLRRRYRSRLRRTGMGDGPCCILRRTISDMKGR